VKEVNSATSCLCGFGHFVEDIKRGLRSLKTSNVVHLKREANLAAHGLARESKLYG
jgi:hypothetical protein